jgi:hypothetical protein
MGDWLVSPLGGGNEDIQDATGILLSYEFA